ncbi:MAG: hypothetical protein ACKOSS_03480 [Planctomycetia bacterium]
MKIVRAAGTLLAYAAVVYLFAFGWYASYCKRGWGGVFGSVIFPPYGWWNSVAYWFEPEPWERNWDERVQGLVRAMWLAPEEASDEQRSALHDLRAWLADVPPARREQLAQSVHSFHVVTMVDVLGIRDMDDLDGVGGSAALDTHRQRAQAEPGLQRELVAGTEAVGASPLLQDAIAERAGQAGAAYAERRAAAELYLARCRALLASWFPGPPR